MLNNFFTILLLIISISSNMLFANTENQKIYNVVVSKNWMPYYYVNKEGKTSGFAVDMFEEIAKNAGIKYKYTVIDNWKEFWPLLNSGEADIIPDISITTNRKESLLFSDTTNTFEITIYKRSNSKSLNNIEDFDNKTVAVIKQNVGETVMKKYPQIKTKIYQNRFDAFYALLSGEVDGFCYPKPLTNYSLKKLNLEDKIIPLKENLFEIKRAVGIISHNKELLQQINHAIKEIKHNGRYNAIYQKWFGKEKSFELSYEQLLYLIIIVILVVMGFLSLVIFYSIRKKWLLTEKGLKKELAIRTKNLEDANKKLQQLATTDYLTAIFNRRHFFDIGKQYLEIAKRNGSTLSMVSFDLDKFKNINDTYGHKTGDIVLIEFTKIVNQFMRKSDLFGRIGGEEFSVLLQNTSLEDSFIVSEKIRKKVETTVIKDDNETINITVSIGIVQLSTENTIDELLEKSDQALYKAKESGRNTIINYKDI